MDPSTDKQSPTEKGQSKYNKKNHFKPENIVESLNCAVDGIMYAVQSQRHMRYHFVIAIIVLLSALYLDLPAFEFSLLAISIVILLFAEMVNTAIEEVVNLLESRYNPIAKRAKDVAAGSVLLSSLCVFIVAYNIVSKYFFSGIKRTLEAGKSHSGFLALASFLLVIIGVVFSKAYLNRGRPFHGGMPSGHAAVAFSLWTSISFISLDPLTVILSFLMAIMISHSRMHRGIHTPSEVAAGAILGIGVTSLIFYLHTLRFI